MTSPTNFVTALARRFDIEIDVNPSGVADWQPLMGVEEFKPDRPQRREADEAYSDDGAARQTITGSSWKIEMKLIHRKVGGAFNSVQEHLRTKAEADDALTGEAHVRWYDESGDGEAYEGRCLVTWTPDGGNGGARDTVAVVLDGQGPRVAITNPNSSPLPVVSALAPATGGVAGGTMVTVKGRKLTGATSVTFGGTAATSFKVLEGDDTRIIALAPAKVASTVDVVVTTPGGVSATSAGSKYIYA